MKNKTNKGFSLLQVIIIIAILIVGFNVVKNLIPEKYEIVNSKELFKESLMRIDFATNKIGGVLGMKFKLKSELELIKLYSQYIATDEICEKSKPNECWSSNWLWDKDSVKPGMLFEEGAFMISDIIDPSCDDDTNVEDTCAILYVDVNGRKKPNKEGIDILKIYVTKDGIILAGDPRDKATPATDCDLKNNYTFGCTYFYR